MSVPTAAPGQVLEDRYRLAEVVGVGGMATVHRARDEVLARDVAVKVFPPRGTTADRGRQQAEIAVLAQRNHPGLVALLDAAVTGCGPLRQTYIVMELVRGPTLAELLATTSVPTEPVDEDATAGPGETGGAGTGDGRGNGCRNGVGPGGDRGRGNGP